MKLKLKVRSKLPAALIGRTGIAVVKDGLKYNLDLDYSGLVQTSQFDSVNDLLAVWNKATGQWNTVSLSSFVGGSFYSATSASQTIPDGTSIVAIQRAGPSATSLTLPLLSHQGGASISIVDWSTSVSSHAITITPSGGATIMQASSWAVYSSAAQFGSATLRPSLDLNGWIISP
jgi:hypothetical protein